MFRADIQIDAFNKHTEEAFGYATYGYWPWHNTEEAVKDCDDHVRLDYSSWAGAMHLC